MTWARDLSVERNWVTKDLEAKLHRSRCLLEVNVYTAKEGKSEE